MTEEIVQLGLNFDDEEWRDVVGYEGYYQVSNRQRVKSLERIIEGYNEFGTVYSRTIKERILNLNPISTGYFTVRLCKSTEPKIVQIHVHSLVAEAFLGKRPEGHQVNHINGVKTDNRPENLEYVTPQRNVQHGWDMGLNPHIPQKLTAEQVVEIRKLRKEGVSIGKLGKLFGVSGETISLIVHRKSWKHIPDQHDPILHITQKDATLHGSPNYTERENRMRQRKNLMIEDQFVEAMENYTDPRNYSFTANEALYDFFTAKGVKGLTKPVKGISGGDYTSAKAKERMKQS